MSDHQSRADFVVNGDGTARDARAQNPPPGTSTSSHLQPPLTPKYHRLPTAFDGFISFLAAMLLTTEFIHLISVGLFLTFESPRVGQGWLLAIGPTLMAALAILLWMTASNQRGTATDRHGFGTSLIGYTHVESGTIETKCVTVFDFPTIPIRSFTITDDKYEACIEERVPSRFSARTTHLFQPYAGHRVYWPQVWKPILAFWASWLFVIPIVLTSIVQLITWIE